MPNNFLLVFKYRHVPSVDDVQENHEKLTGINEAGTVGRAAI